MIWCGLCLTTQSSGIYYYREIITTDLFWIIPGTYDHLASMVFSPDTSNVTQDVRLVRLVTLTPGAEIWQWDIPNLFLRLWSVVTLDQSPTSHKHMKPCTDFIILKNNTSLYLQYLYCSSWKISYTKLREQNNNEPTFVFKPV